MSQIFVCLVHLTMRVKYIFYSFPFAVRIKCPRTYATGNFLLAECLLCLLVALFHPHVRTLSAPVFSSVGSQSKQVLASCIFCGEGAIKSQLTEESTGKFTRPAAGEGQTPIMCTLSVALWREWRVAAFPDVPYSWWHWNCMTPLLWRWDIWPLGKYHSQNVEQTKPLLLHEMFFLSVIARTKEAWPCFLK